MAREIQIVSWCDFCPDGSRTPAGGSWTVAMADGNSAPRDPHVIDLCDEHMAEVTEFAARVITRGAKADGSPVPPRPPRPAKAATPADRTCPECGYVSTSRDGVRAHLAGQHGLTLGEAGLAKVDDGRTQPVDCPECGRTMGGAQGLAAHRRARHGVPGAKARAAANGQQALIA